MMIRFILLVFLLYCQGKDHESQTVSIYFLCYLDSLGQQLQANTNNSTKMCVELVGGRGGLHALTGPTGPPGPKGKEGSPGPQSGGAMYVRWGSGSCPTSTTGAKLVYSGSAGGSWWAHRGGGANYQCLPKDPEYSPDLTYRPGTQNYALIYGAEYQLPTKSFTQDHNVPCAVCRVPTRTSVLMIPAKYRCPQYWTREYYGYLMSESHAHHRSTYECMDKEMEHLRGGQGDTNGALFEHVESRCNPSLPCDRYYNAKEMNCVVCTK